MHSVRSSLVLLSAAVAVAMIANVDAQIDANFLSHVCQKVVKTWREMSEDQFRNMGKQVLDAALANTHVNHLLNSLVFVKPSSEVAVTNAQQDTRERAPPFKLTIEAKKNANGPKLGDFPFEFTVACTNINTPQATGEIVDCKYVNAAQTKQPVPMDQTRKIKLGEVEYCAKCMKTTVPDITKRDEMNAQPNAVKKCHLDA